MSRADLLGRQWRSVILKAITPALEVGSHEFRKLLYCFKQIHASSASHP